MAFVVNLKTARRIDWDVRIDRGTPWGNPFVIGKDGTRDEVIAKYRRWLWERVKAPPHGYFLQDLALLHGKRMACHCAPQRCHGEVLARAATWVKGELAAGRLK